MIGIAIANSCGLGKAGTTTTTTTTAAFDPAAQAFITAAGITDPTQQAAINNLVIGLKADGLWASMYAIYPFVGGTASTHKWNLKDPRDLSAAFRIGFNGGMTHSANGILFNGTNGWADTSNTNDTATFGVYTRNVTDNGADYMGSQDSFYDEDAGSWTLLSGYQVAHVAFIISYGYAFASTNNTIRTGLNTVTNDGSQKYYKNGVLKSTASSIALIYPGYTMGIGALNPNSNTLGGTFGIEGYSNQQIAFAFMASTSFNATQNTNLYTRVQAFQTALSRQV
jgi:hypothetical protein